MVEKVYLAIDGDDVGRRLEFFLLTNQVEALNSFSQSFQAAIDWLTLRLVELFDAKLIFKGGDNFLAVLESQPALQEELDTLKNDFLERSTCTLSIGLGMSPSQAYIALKLAKAAGKDRLCRYDEVHLG